jgi:hypothetical protein
VAPGNKKNVQVPRAYDYSTYEVEHGTYEKDISVVYDDMKREVTIHNSNKYVELKVKILWRVPAGSVRR